MANLIVPSLLQLSVKTQRLEELAIKQSRQLIPVTPSGSKTSVTRFMSLFCCSAPSFWFLFFPDVWLHVFKSTFFAPKVSVIFACGQHYNNEVMLFSKYECQ